MPENQSRTRDYRATERILISPIIDVLNTLYTHKNKKVEPVFELKTERLRSYTTRLICL